jgi:hypothetical protein
MATKKDDDNLSKSDLDTIIEVNRKTIEVQLEVSDQNEKIIEGLEQNKKNDEEIIKLLEKIKERIDENDRKLLKIEILLASGLISLIIQLIQIFAKK